MPDQYKLPTDIESRFIDRFTVRDEDDNGNEFPVLSLPASTFVESDESIGELTEFLATEQVTLLEWMLNEVIGADEKPPTFETGQHTWISGKTIELKNALKEEARAKVQAKLQEYKV